MDKTATFSEDRVYRYALTRTWGAAPPAAFIGLNPSTADETLDDPTIRRCIGFARAWGCGGIVMLNIFAFRATDPKDMYAADLNALGPRNNEYLLQAGRAGEIVIAAWGVHGAHMDREKRVQRMFASGNVDLHALGLSKAGHPRHPLYLRRDLKPFVWSTSYNGSPVVAARGL